MHPHPMEAALREAKDRRGATGLLVTYSDMHGLWGGVTMTLTGGGDYERTSREPGGPPAAVRRRVAAGRVAAIVGLLLEIDAWEQGVAERPPLPDESRATLTIRCGGAETSIWERYNDLRETQRLARVRDALAGVAAEDDA
jgi:hypothetical protein